MNNMITNLTNPLFRGTRRSRCVPFFFAIFVVLGVSSVPAYAHKVNMFGYIEGNKVLIEGFFSDGNKPMNCDVIVSDSKGTELVKGKTDKNGKFSFDIPAITDLHVVLNAGMGHRATYNISREELQGSSSDGIPSAHAAQLSSAVAESTSETESSGASSNIDPATLRIEITRANAPVIRAMEELKDSVSFSNIVGGIGFIVGILGGSFYILARKKFKQSSRGI
jgi:nickel transport protein